MDLRWLRRGGGGGLLVGRSEVAGGRRKKELGSRLYLLLKRGLLGRAAGQGRSIGAGGMDRLQLGERLAKRKRRGTAAWRDLGAYVHRLRSADGRDRRARHPQGRRSEPLQSLGGRPSPSRTLRPPSGDAWLASASDGCCAASQKHGPRASTGQSGADVTSAGHAGGAVRRSTW